MKSRKKKRKITKKTKKLQVLGQVTHYFKKINVAVIKLKAEIKVGEYIKFRTKDGEFVQMVESMQVNHKDIASARRGSEIGLKVIQEVKTEDQVFKSEVPQPIVVEEKIEYTPLFSFKPSKPKSSSPPPQSPILKKPIQQPKREGVYSHPLIKDRTCKPSRPHFSPQPQARQPQEKKKSSGYSGVKFLKF